MQLLHHWCHRIVTLSGTRRYLPEELEAMCRRLSPPFWIRVEGTIIRIRDQSQMSLAYQLCAAYHNGIVQNVPHDDGAEKETEEMERRAQQHMEAESSSEDEADYLTEEEDMVYDREFYI